MGTCLHCKGRCSSVGTFLLRYSCPLPRLIGFSGAIHFARSLAHSIPLVTLYNNGLHLNGRKPRHGRWNFNYVVFHSSEDRDKGLQNFFLNGETGLSQVNSSFHPPTPGRVWYLERTVKRSDRRTQIFVMLPCLIFSLVSFSGRIHLRCSMAQTKRTNAMWYVY